MKMMLYSQLTAAIALAMPAAGCHLEQTTDSVADLRSPLPGVSFGDVIADGSGCPDGADIEIDSTGLVTVTPTAYRAGAGALRQACILSMAVDVSDGRRLGIADGAVTGRADIGAGGSGRVSIERALVGEIEEKVSQSFGPGTSGRFAHVDDSGVRWSACGASTIANVHTSLTAQGDALVEGTSIAVQLVVEDCGTEDPPAEDPPAEDPPAEDPPAEDPPAGDPSLLARVQFGDAIVGGTGCRAGTADIDVSPDHRRVSIDATAYTATTSGGIADTRKACSSRVFVDVPADVRLGIARASVTGSSQLAAGTSGTVRVVKHFATTDVEDPLERTLAGPRTGPFTVDHGAAVTWSPCGFNGAMAIDSSLRVRGADGELRATSVDAILVAEACP